MYERILVAIASGPSAHAAIRHAAILGAVCKSEVKILHVLDVLSYANGFERPAIYRQVVLPAMLAAGRKTLEDAQQTLDDLGVKSEVLLEQCGSRDIPEIIVETAKAWNCDLTVVSTQGRAGLDRLVMGSDAEAVVKTSSTPVLLVRHTEFDENIAHAAEMYKRILVAVDGSETSNQALDHAARLAKFSGARLHVVYVVEYPSALYMSSLYDPEPFHEAMKQEGEVVLGRAKARMAECGVNGETKAVDTQDAGQSVAQALDAEARKVGAELVIMGTNGRRGFQRLILGSVAESMARLASVPVLLVPDAAPKKT